MFIRYFSRQFQLASICYWRLALRRSLNRQVSRYIRHTMYRVWTINRHSVQLSIIHAEAVREILFITNAISEAHSIWEGSMTGIASIRSIHSLVLELSRLWASMIRRRMDGSAVRLVQFNFVLQHFTWPEVAILQTFEMLEHSCKFVAKRRTLVWYHELLSPSGIRSFLQHFHCVVEIHSLIAVLIWGIENGIHGRNGTSIVALRWNVTLTLLYVWVIVPGLEDVW